ncbi:MAG: type II toxin-antitoxin system Phd/YefM family antitoxin [Clostridiales bacterium]|nr:type II toxin-antitoxin system Phd/YefM family antitoxin [Clostridiales bacterium]
MNINVNNLISITDANQNFSKVTKKVEENGKAIILKNNKPKYVVSCFDEAKFTDENQLLCIVAKLILTEHINAFKELAK